MNLLIESTQTTQAIVYPVFVSYWLGREQNSHALHYRSMVIQQLKISPDLVYVQVLQKNVPRTLRRRLREWLRWRWLAINLRHLRWRRRVEWTGETPRSQELWSLLDLSVLDRFLLPLSYSLPYLSSLNLCNSALCSSLFLSSVSR